MMAKKDSQGETWIYADGTKVVFRNGVAAGAPLATSSSLERSEEEEENTTVVAAPTPAARSTREQRQKPSVVDSEPKSRSLFKRSREASPFVNVLIMACGAVALISNVWFIILTFQQGLLWGVGNLFLPLVGLVFLFKFWDVAKAPFFTSIGAVAAMFALAFSAG